jgi:hypothetical protein
MNPDVLNARLKFLTLIASSAAAARDSLAKALALGAQADTIPAVSAADPEVVGTIRANGHAATRNIMAAAARQSGPEATMKAMLTQQAQNEARVSIGETMNVLNMAKALGDHAAPTPEELAALRG